MLNKTFKLLIAAIISVSAMSCSDENSDDQEKEDQLQLDEAARKLDQQMPSARAERIANEAQDSESD